MKLNKKGFTGIEVILIIAAIAAATFFTAPQVGKGINNVFQGDKNKQKAVYSVKESYPLFYKDKDGNYAPAKQPYKREESSLQYAALKAPETLMEKFIGLGAWLLLIGAAITFLGGWPLVMVWRSKIKNTLAKKAEEYQDLEDETSTIVNSIEAGLNKLPADQKQIFLDELSKKQDSTTKELVSKLKHK